MKILQYLKPPCGYWWLRPVILALRRQRSGGSQFKAGPGKKFERSNIKGWHSGSSDRVPAKKCEVLSSNPSTTKNKRSEATINSVIYCG
jgi:hypothetical protein